MKLLTLTLSFASMIWSQEFEVASIRPAVQDGNRDSDVDNGLFRTHNLTLKRLVAMAWDVEEQQVLGGPKWVDSESWDINAKIPMEFAERRQRDTVPKMIQALLADRFHLKIHRERREVSGFHLVVAKNGPRMAIAKADEKGAHFTANNTHLTATNVTMQGFAVRLSRDRDVAKIVIDKTGLTGTFDFELNWARADDTSAERPVLFTAIQEQLGLKLEPVKIPIQAVVIDEADKPTEN
ncbi:MAG: TIGR03435 family protein [Bryobacterales bacterium]|nr:TIGR03435 family protein [Bryobacterales bacterium]